MSVLVIGLLLLGLSSITQAFAAPPTALPFCSGVNTGYYAESYTIRDWFVFETDGVYPVSFWFDRTEPSPDLYARLYRGDATTGEPLTVIGRYDDTHNDNFGGPYGDPHFVVDLAPGVYSAELYTLNNAGGYQFDTNQNSLYHECGVSDPCDLNSNGLFDNFDVEMQFWTCYEESEGSHNEKFFSCLFSNMSWKQNECADRTYTFLWENVE